MKKVNVDWFGKNQKKAAKRCEKYAERVEKLRKEKQSNAVRSVL